MDENPYQSPAADSTGPQYTSFEVPTHRSFRLTQSGVSECSDGETSDRHTALVFAVVQQLLLILVSQMVLDGGDVFRVAAVSIVVFWALVLGSSYRLKPQSSHFITMLKWGTWPVFFATVLLVAIVRSFG